MRILYITGSYLPYLSGVTISIRDFKQELEKLGHEVVLLAPFAPGYKDIEPGVVRYPSLPLPSWILRRLFKEKFDLVHVHHPFYIGSFAAFVASLKKIPLVYSFHTRYD